MNDIGSQMYPKFVRIVEVGPRDGLQNTPQVVATDIKKTFINRLALTGLKNIEAASFVSPKWVPQMADSDVILSKCCRQPGVRLSALVPNLRGFVRAAESQVDEVAVFTAASETFTQKNINCSIAGSLKRFEPIVEQAQAANIPVRGYISCALGCPYEGDIDPHQVAQLAGALHRLGCYEISIGDTIGVGTVRGVQQVLEAVVSEVPIERIAVHFHNTLGQALVNIKTALALGVSVVDSATAGLGGCPYANGASGNVATEDLLYMLHGMGISTGVCLDKVIEAGHYITQTAGLANYSMVGCRYASHSKK